MNNVKKVFKHIQKSNCCIFTKIQNTIIVHFTFNYYTLFNTLKQIKKKP